MPMFNSGQIEISQDVTIQAAIHFWVDRAEWAAMDDDAKRATIGDKIDAAAIRASNDCFDFPGGTISASIDGPDTEKINLDQVSIYDPDPGSVDYERPRIVFDWSGPEEGDEGDESVWITTGFGDEIEEVDAGFGVERNKEIARDLVEKINALPQPLEDGIIARMVAEAVAAA